MNEEIFRGTLGDKEWRILLEQDQDAHNPRTGEDNLWTLVCAHKRYTLGDQQIKDSEDFDDILTQAGLTPETALVCPIYMYDHSGLAFSTTPFNDRWDSGQLGQAFISLEKIKAEFDGDADKAQAALKIELDTYQSYVGGEVYGIVYETRAKVDPNRDADDAGGDWDTTDSCWGYYGADSAKAALGDVVPAEVMAIIQAPKEEVSAPARGRRPGL